MPHPSTLLSIINISENYTRPSYHFLYIESNFYFERIKIITRYNNWYILYGSTAHSSNIFFNTVKHLTPFHVPHWNQKIKIKPNNQKNLLLKQGVALPNSVAKFIVDLGRSIYISFRYTHTHATHPPITIDQRRSV